ncbi:MAG: oligosaccharide flippase family protein [Lawsonibacter sp.]|nr:oligosaccharide flippase family protein [Lawsonibacter sp.]
MSERVLSAGQGALLLTGLGAASQVLSFLYRVALSRLVGAEVMGLYQLVMPVQAVMMSLTAVGFTSAVSNLTSQHLALGNRLGAAQTLRICQGLFFLLLLPIGAVVILASDAISTGILGDARTQLGLILLVPCIALMGVENCHKQFFYGAGLVRAPAVVELLEQLVRTVAVLGLLLVFLPQYPERVVGLIVGGMVVCEVFSASTLVLLYRRHMARTPLSGPGESVPVRCRRVFAIALPVGMNALLGNLMGAANSTLIPRKLVEGGMAREAAVSQLGVVCGMTLPMLALPTVFLGALNLVLMPRLARAAALGRPAEVRRLTGRAISAVAVLALPSMAWMAVLGPDLGQTMFHQEGVGEYRIPLAAMMAMSCFCSVLASTLNGVGRQREVAAVSLLGGGTQLVFTLLLVPLPGVGMGGYVAGAVVSTALETGLCLALVARHTGLRLQFFQWLTAPGLAALLSALTANLLLRNLKERGLPPLAACAAVLLFALVLYLTALAAQGVRLGQILRVKGK